jgi:hypothetical protein
LSVVHDAALGLGLDLIQHQAQAVVEKASAMTATASVLPSQSTTQSMPVSSNHATTASTMQKIHAANANAILEKPREIKQAIAMEYVAEYNDSPTGSTMCEE